MDPVSIDPAWIAVAIAAVGQIVIAVWVIGLQRAALIELRAQHASTSQAVDRMRTYMREIDERSRQNRDEIARMKGYLGLNGATR